MKKIQLIIAVSLTLASISVRADLANYQTTVSGQSPAYYFHLDNSLSSVGGTATFTANGGATFGSDYSANANDAALFPASSDYLSLANPPAVISGEGTTTAIGSLSLLFYVPSTIPATGYYFSDSDITGGAAGSQPANSAFALQFSSSALALKLVNTTVALPAVTANTWYYLALTYNLNGSVTSVNGVNWYLGAVGGTLSSGFKQKGGSGNINTAGTLGDGNTFIVGNKQAAVVGVPATSTAGVAGGEIDELATWSSQLTGNQITSQFNALTVSVPEPSTCILFGAGGLLVLWTRRTFRHDLPGK
jgi:hypothetical protein